MPKAIAILGSTGSIGVQALQVVREQPAHFQVELLSCGNNCDLLIEQALEFKPNAVVIGNESRYAEVRDVLFPQGIKVFAGADALEQAVRMEGIELVLTALVGYAGLRPTLAAIDAGKHIALANKETLVVAGELVTKAAREKGVNIYPVDSEHSAIFQCLVGEWHNPIEKVILTASGGPFRGKTRAHLAQVKKADALKHPNWEMGAKITIDSASLMNKGLEAIEAKWLFNLNAVQIEIVVHPQSIIHSMVQFRDGSMKAQMGLPDMKLPIQYAMAYPERLPTKWPRLDFFEAGIPPLSLGEGQGVRPSFSSLTFEKPDLETFQNLALALEAMEKGGNAPCVLNAANEVAVELFLQERIGFLEMSDLVSHCLATLPHIVKPTLKDLEASDAETRRVAYERIPAWNS
ncbi:MAG TPA: 1-deoxy-D-xylulose-5-phosphate reductoisomerase [Flavobacteriales bacterium]|nr:1-deoxy-D-xylulose-5-phosphate reductoisomerase [Flavobacteriales bacterium]HQV76603.1 1-deoxy-D-xylulose-5-phosphate reductoisomerase [Flavobacteriales bacterium]HQW41200.1 1-deoxy-D-xylulose-5-phosphate reductoisomerase [Flavobacteriales bacterium]